MKRISPPALSIFVAATARRMRSASTSAWSIRLSASATANSSPPSRPRTSPGRRAPVVASVSACRSRSPVGWPQLSFNALEPVEIEQEERRPGAGAPGPRKHPADLVGESAAIADAGQRIEKRGLAMLLADRLLGDGEEQKGKRDGGDKRLEDADRMERRRDADVGVIAVRRRSAKKKRATNTMPWIARSSGRERRDPPAPRRAAPQLAGHGEGIGGDERRRDENPRADIRVERAAVPRRQPEQRGASASGQLLLRPVKYRAACHASP